MLSDGHSNPTLKDQSRLEGKLIASHQDLLGLNIQDLKEAFRLNRCVHVEYLHNQLSELPPHCEFLDSSRTWAVFWILNSLKILEAPLPEKPGCDSVIKFLSSCQHPEGGFGGGPHQLAHLASTYAAVGALVSLGGVDALGVVDRRKMMVFLERMCVDPGKGGGMTVYEGGEVDLRACYTAVATAHMLGLEKEALAEKCGMVDYIRRCQSHEGGLGGEPGNEAHGGNTFCGVAALVLLGKLDVLNLPKLLHWVVNMQGSVEGGFMGRTNKLVDGCYSYWQGSLFPLLESLTDGLSFSPVGGQVETPDVPDLPFIKSESPVLQARAQRKRRLTELAADVGLEPNALYSQLLDESVASDEGEAKLSLPDEIKRDLTTCTTAILAAESSIDNVLSQIMSDETFRTSLCSRLPEADAEEKQVLYDVLSLQSWILLHCQGKLGGLRDKPGKPADLYHTCYCLSGLAVAQLYSGLVLGPVSNILAKPDPAVNVVQSQLDSAIQYYSTLPL